jgi:hypothetical protein
MASAEVDEPGPGDAGAGIERDLGEHDCDHVVRR